MKKVDKIFKEIHIEKKSFDHITKDNNIPRSEVSEYNKKFKKERGEEIDQIRRIRQIYNNKKDLKEFKIKPFEKFYNWYKKKFKKQEGQCYYCKVEERKIRELVENKVLTSKRFEKRARHLEVERKDPNVNSYNPENCALACYFCNNDKSDVISEKHYFKYFTNEENPYRKSARKRYIDDLYDKYFGEKIE